MVCQEEMEPDLLELELIATLCPEVAAELEWAFEENMEAESEEVSDVLLALEEDLVQIKI